MEERISDILAIVERFWGFDELRPLQAEAIQAGMAGRDSLVVLPTGGGKSLCYQVPPALSRRTDLVVSPLISLMKDQVDGLRACGYPAAALHSNLSPDERIDIRDAAANGEYRLLFVSPERLAMPAFVSFLADLDVRAFAIDEAHCISHWGHDFRPEYRMLADLRDRFPDASFHAFTATATERVREDIVAQLRLRDPEVLVGRFDRPNLVYRVRPKVDVKSQVLEVIERLSGGAAIVYCLSRKDTERLAEALKASGVQAAAYHAGLSKARRTKAQDDFAAERLDVVVATVAFGMGIDRSDVRAVIHASLPLSIEHYQQETGRAGRDGLEAECVLLYSYSDVIRWEQLLGRSTRELGARELGARELGAEETGGGNGLLKAQRALLDEMQNYCGALRCRHVALSRYFGQDLADVGCGACDVCLDEVDAMPDSTVVAQKILSGVARTGQRYGIGYVVQVLRGSDNDMTRGRGHQSLSTFGLLKDLPDKAITNLIYQLVNQGLLDRTPGDRPILRLNRDSLAVLKSEKDVKLTEPAVGKRVRKAPAAAAIEIAGMDAGLYERLRTLRREIAERRSVPAYVVFGDRTLRELAAVRPTSPVLMHRIHGVGEKKLEDLGPEFLGVIADYSAENGLDTDIVI